MNLSTIIYLAQLSNNLSLFMMIGCFISFVILCTCLAISLVEEKIIPYTFLKYMIPIWMFFSFMACALPSKNTIYTIIAANGVTDLAKTPEADKARKVLNLGLDKMINNLQESK